MEGLGVFFARYKADFYMIFVAKRGIIRFFLLSLQQIIVL